MKSEERQAFNMKVEGQDETIEVDAQIEAVDEAKRRSRDTKRSVKLERLDGQVVMLFREGSLFEYKFVTPGRGRGASWR